MTRWLFCIGACHTWHGGVCLTCLASLPIALNHQGVAKHQIISLAPFQGAWVRHMVGVPGVSTLVTQNAKDFVNRLGPGLIRGAADDDPSGIATYSQAGSQFRFSLVWTLLLTTPLMIGIQMLSARIGWVTGEGLAANINKQFPRWLTKSLVGLLVVANTINIAADIGAINESLQPWQFSLKDTSVKEYAAMVVALCIVIATAVTLNEQGITNIQTSSQAAEALRPVAAEFAFLIFALGIIGTGLLAVPVLAGSAAYAVSELYGWKASLSHGFREARGFYLIIIAATGIGTLMGYFEVDPIKALVWSAIVNGVISVPIMAAMMLVGQSEKLMGQYTISARHRFFGWGATLVMAVAVLVMFATSF